MSTLMRAVNGQTRLGLAGVIRCMSGGSQVPDFGSGAGHGGGGGGSVRESGGAFGVREAAMEEKFFRHVCADQLEALHDHHVEEIRFLEKQLKDHQELIDKQKQRLAVLKKVKAA